MMKRTLATVFVCLVLALAGATGAHARCGDEGQRACPVTVQLKGCNGKRVEVRGRCESCGANGQRACPITVQLKGCNGKQIEVKGRCEPCGKLDQRACPLTVALQSCQGKLVERGGQCRLSAEFVADPFTIFNKTDKAVFYTVHFNDLKREVDYGGPFNRLTQGTIAPGGKVEVTLAGNTCLPAGVKRDNAAVALSATTHDSCKGESFGIIFWKTEARYRERVRDASAALVLRKAYGAAMSEIVGAGELTGEAVNLIADAYFNWVINEMYGRDDGQIPYEWAITSIVPNVPQEGLWVAYWGEKRPVETGFYKDKPPNLSKLTPPCSRPAPAKFKLVVKGVETQGTWSCGAIHTPQ
jgi:hypothetical protein